MTKKLVKLMLVKINVLTCDYIDFYKLAISQDKKLVKLMLVKSQCTHMWVHWLLFGTCDFPANNFEFSLKAKVMGWIAGYLLKSFLLYLHPQFRRSWFVCCFSTVVICTEVPPSSTPDLKTYYLVNMPKKVFQPTVWHTWPERILRSKSSK